MPPTLGEVDLKLPPETTLRLEALGAWGKTLDSTVQVYAREVQQAVSARK
jgi:hypothetical protein